jgi:hypothetical protein
MSLLLAASVLALTGAAQAEVTAHAPKEKMHYSFPFGAYTYTSFKVRLTGAHATNVANELAAIATKRNIGFEIRPTKTYRNAHYDHIVPAKDLTFIAKGGSYDFGDLKSSLGDLMKKYNER